MPYSEQHMKMTVYGDLNETDETWAFSLRFRLPTGTGTTDLATVWPLWTTYFGMSGAQLVGPVRAVGLKLAFIDTDGRYTDTQDNPLVYEPATPFSTGLGSGIKPPQCSIVVSLTTGFRRGYAHIGRFYLPPTGQAVGADFRLSVSDVQQVANASAQLIRDLEDIMGAQVAVFSDVGMGTTRQVLGVRVGRVVDTQRRRRRSLDEAYVEAAVPPMAPPG